MTDGERDEVMGWAKRYYETRVDELEKRMRIEFDLRERALIVAEKNVAIELTHLNQLREAFQNKEGKFATKDDLTARIDTMNAEMRTLGASLGAEIRAVNHSLTTEIKGLELWKAEHKGKASQLALILASVPGWIGLIVLLAKMFMGKG